ncbi:hypothetical protein Dimus_016244 [Dionaea muscipula]
MKKQAAAGSSYSPGGARRRGSWLAKERNEGEDEKAGVGGCRRWWILAKVGSGGGKVVGDGQRWIKDRWWSSSLMVLMMESG